MSECRNLRGECSILNRRVIWGKSRGEENRGRGGEGRGGQEQGNQSGEQVDEPGGT